MNMTSLYAGRIKIYIIEIEYYLSFGFQTKYLELNVMSEAGILCVM